MKKQLKGKKNKLTSAGFVLLIFAVLIGCAGTDEMSRLEIYQMLLRAGFQFRTADTPKKLDFLKSLPQKELVHKMYNEKMFYFYVDGSSCQCVYVGDEQAYLRFRQSVKEEQMDERIATTRHQVGPIMENMGIDPNSPLNTEGRIR